MHDRADRLRIWVVVALLMLVLSGLGGQLCSLHLGNHSKVSRDWETTLLARRGTIFDRNGRENPMAASLPGRMFFMDPTQINPKHDRAQLAARIAEALNMDVNRVITAMNRTNSRYVPLAVSLDDAVFERLADKQTISGIGWEAKVVRSYPQGRRMAHVLGFTHKVGSGNASVAGAAGVELRQDQYLEGTAGLIQGEVDALRNEIWDRRKCFVSAIEGSNIHLTLDHNIQFVVERELRAVVEKFQATAAWAIVQRVSTGEILAMASLPDFDPNQYADESIDVWRNSGLGVVYEPGSTMKAIIVAAALNEKLITPETRMDVGMGSWYYAGHILRDHVEGVIDITTLLKKSSNIGAAKTALLLGNRRMEAYLHGFGFGRRTGIDLPGEEGGILMPSRQWSQLSPTRMAIGQGVAVTALQMLGAYCAIANEGRLMWPHVVDRIESPTGEVLYRAVPRMISRPIRPEIAAKVRRMLIGVTEDGGTATRAAVENYSVAGKTGTGQIPMHGGYSETDYWASFVGFCPAEKPDFGVIVVVERPKPQHTGGFVAAPVFGKIAEAVAHYLEIPADMPASRTTGSMAMRMPASRPISGPAAASVAQR